MSRYILFLLCFVLQLEAFKLDRVILATDANPDYIEFWPIVAKAWQEIIGIKPTLALIARDDVHIDESLGDVIRFEPIEGIPTSFQAQVIRLFLPALYPTETCILSDIDMIPLNKSYYLDSVKNCPEDSFVIYRNKAYREDELAYPMCYLAARGSTFGEVFDVKYLQDISAKIASFYAYGLGWCSDELLLYKYLDKWQDFGTRCIKLDHYVGPRVDRVNWQLDRNLLRSGHYIDAHCPRPYSAYKSEIDSLLWLNSRLSKLPIFPHDEFLLNMEQISGELGVLGEQQVVRSMIDPDDVVFDIGAGVGSWTYMVHKIVQPVNFYVFEPLTEAVEMLKKYANLANVQLFQQAFSNKKGISNFYYYPFEVGDLSSLYKRNRLEASSGMFCKEIQIATDTLDNFCNDHAVKHINFLKISAEGAEYDVLKGAESLLAQKKIDFIQFGYGDAYEDARRSLKEVHELLRNNEYQIFKICPDGIVHIKKWYDALENFKRARFLAVSRSIADYSHEMQLVFEAEKDQPRCMEGTDATHMTMLLAAVTHTTGPILEMGVGDLSTPLLHALCLKDKRCLVSADTSRKKLHYYNDLEAQWHTFKYIPVYEDDWSVNPKPQEWDVVDAHAHWSVVLINHRPGSRRIEDIERLRHNTEIFVIHDTQESGYNYHKVINSFKYCYVDRRYTIQTTLVSDVVDVSQFFNK